MKLLFCLCLFSSGISIISSAFYAVGDRCLNPDESIGICTLDKDCPEAKLQINTQRYHNFTHCGWKDKHQVLCCPPEVRQVATTATKRKCVKACDFYYPVDPVYFQISQGSDANIKEFPFMAALGMFDDSTKTYKFRCGGTLISDRYILTAAHCYRGDPIKIARLGQTRVPLSIQNPNEYIDFPIKRYIKHKKYVRIEHHNDIALLELETPLNLTTDGDFIQVACLNSRKSIPTNFIIAGWGGTNDEEERTEILQKASVNLTSSSECREKYATHYSKTLQDYHICAVNGGQDTCNGDSGGPLLLEDSPRPTIAGVTSFGPDHCGTGYPTVYSNIYPYLDWIEKIVWPDDI